MEAESPCPWNWPFTFLTIWTTLMGRFMCRSLWSKQANSFWESWYCEMHIKRIKTNLLSFLLLAQFIVDRKVPIWVALATCVLKGWHKGTHVHHNMKACTCTKETTLSRLLSWYSCFLNIKNILDWYYNFVCYAFRKPYDLCLAKAIFILNC